jgi:hypothetical protein
MTQRSFVALAVLGAVLCAQAAVARADGKVFVHIVRPSETLASIAQLYYGDPRRENVLVMENGLNTQGGAAIVVGVRLDIPVVSYHRVAAGETWPQLAELFYGEPRRAATLIEANGGSSVSPDMGAEILVPYPLRHVAGQRETLNDVAQMYYGRTDAAASLRRFNNIRGNRLTRGQIILVPLPDLVLSTEGKALVARFDEVPHPVPADGGAVRALQARIDDELPVLREHVRRGRFTEAVALGNRLLGAGELTGNQIVTIQRELGTAYVALEREDLALRAYREVIARQPDAEMDSIRTSPRVLAAFRAARAAGAPAEVPDGGVVEDAALAGPDAGGT